MTTMPPVNTVTQVATALGQPGIYEGITFTDYHTGPGLSRSDLTRLLKTSAHWKWGKVKETPAMRFGRAAHCCVLEPELWESRYRIPVKGAHDDGRIALSPDEWAKCLAIREAVWNHRTCQDLFWEGHAERTAYWIDPGTFLLCKIRPDWSWGKVLVDLKTAVDASPTGFVWAVRRYLYHLQAAFYVDGWEAAGGEPIEEFIFIAVEKTPPFAVGLYRLPESALMRGRELYRQGLDIFNRCLTRQSWPSYSQEIVTLDI